MINNHRQSMCKVSFDLRIEWTISWQFSYLYLIFHHCQLMKNYCLVSKKWTKVFVQNIEKYAENISAKTFCVSLTTNLNSFLKSLMLTFESLILKSLIKRKSLTVANGFALFSHSLTKLFSCSSVSEGLNSSNFTIISQFLFVLSRFQELGQELPVPLWISQKGTS